MAAAVDQRPLLRTTLNNNTKRRRVANLDKVNHYGIEVIDSITWQGWEPGNEYTKNIVLKNVKVKTQKLKYTVPSSRFFTTLYPKSVMLSAGTSFTLPVTFRPLEKSTYEDRIEFQTNDGQFIIPIKALLPQYDLSLPEGQHFDMCAANDNVQLQFEIKNNSELQTAFRWDVSAPFSIEPKEAVIEPWGTYQLQATFQPVSALVYQANAICRYGKELQQSKITTFEGIGRFPHLLVSAGGKESRSLGDNDTEAVVDFGEIPLGSSLEKWVEVHNLSPVSAPFTVQQPTGSSRIDTVFSCPQRSGVVPPMSVLRVPITFCPNSIDSTSLDYFHVVAIGNVSKTVVKCLGSSVGPRVELSSKAINFLQIEQGETATRTVDIVNKSNVTATFQFSIDCSESVFKFEHVDGILGPNTSRTIIIHFSPSHPINYYRRLACLVHNHEPLFLDLLGTCHSEQVKPAVLQVKHLERYKKHVDRGFSVFPPEQLNEMLKNKKLSIDESGSLMMQLAETMEPLCEPPPPPIPARDEYFNDGYHSDITHTHPHVSMDIHQADFGHAPNMRCIEQKSVNVTNHTKGKVTVTWVGSTEHVFSISPASLDIPPLKTCSFRITFKPNAPNMLYGSELECYAYYKSLRDYKLVEDATHSPPWCLTLTCTGQTFLPSHETFLPRCTLDSPKLVFAAVNSNQATYRTLLMSRTGTTPVLYHFNTGDSGTFSVKPSKGLLTGSHQIFTVKILPKEVRTYKEILKLRLNDNEKNTQDIMALGSAEMAQVLLENKGVMYFKPTCVGTASLQQYAVKNVSRIPLSFEWMLRCEDAKVLTVLPRTGIIQPNESQVHRWSFVPRAEGKLVMKPALIVHGLKMRRNRESKSGKELEPGQQPGDDRTSGGKKREFGLRVVGHGAIGEIKTEQTYIDFGNVVVGNSIAKHITIINSSNCAVHYRLHVTQSLTGDYPPEQVQADPIALKLEKMEGVLPARSREDILGVVRPARRMCYQFAVLYQLLQPERASGELESEELQHLCHVLTTGVFPVMAVTDARCYGSAIGISKKQLWGLFSLDSLNVCLDSDPSPAELTYSVATRHSHRRRPPVYTRAILDFNFSAAPLGSEPCMIQLMLENTGTVTTEWDFLFPKDLQLELEYWAETGEFDEDEMHEMKVMENRLFVIEPKRGRMEPGETQIVSFTYKHTMAGTDRLPVLLKLTGGREILLNFIGVTVEPDRRYIHFPSNKHMFVPVPVGEKTSPTQIYELYNGGAVPVVYDFNTTPLEIIKQENFDHAIFECINPRGEILPGRTANIEWRFSPLEAKTYMVDVPVRIHNGDSALITFTGVGYDKRQLGDTLPMTDQADLTGVPGVQNVPVPGQLVYLSQERVSMGNLPLFSQERQVVFVTNRSGEHTVSFEWHVTCKADSQYVNIQPTRGVLQPGQATVCRITFTACGVPAFYDLDLICEVTDESEMALYRKKLLDWEAEQCRQEVEFTITEEDLLADQRFDNAADDVLPDIEGRPRSGQLRSLEDGVQAVSDENLSHYMTLPPIRQLSCAEQRVEKRRMKKMQESFWEKPIKPNVFLLHLGVTARTHDITEFQTNFPDQHKKYFIDRTMGEPSALSVLQDRKVAAPEGAAPVECLEVEGDIVSAALANIIRGLLDDNNFHETIKKIPEEKTPYFRQFGDKPSRAPSEVEEDIEPELAELAGPASETATEKKAIPKPRRITGMEELDGDEVTPEPSIPSPTYSSSSVDQTSGALYTGQQALGALEDEQVLIEKQLIKRHPVFGTISESLVANALMNICSEAFNQDFNITARPRLVALPPKPRSAQGRGGGNR